MPYWLENLLSNRYFLPGLGAFVVLVIVIVLMRRQPKVFVAFGEGGDSVRITRRAVRELVQRCCEELGGVGSARADVRIRAGELHTRVELRLKRDANLKGITGYLREQISQALTENLGIEKIGDIEIVVVGILADEAIEAQ
jgi:hypothetical protein